MKSIDIVSKIVAREGEAKASPSKGIQSINLSDYLLKSVWDKVFEIRTDSQGTEYIFGKLPVVTQSGITMYSGDGVDVPSLASGLPFDGRTIWYNQDTQQIEVIGGTGGGSGEGVSNFWDLSGIPSWITISKPKYTYSEIEGTPDLTQYALVSQIPSLSGYATESWVLQKNYATKATTLSGYGITDAYTKTNVDDLLLAYVTLGGSQTITGEKNFTGGLKVNGSPIYYDSAKKYWKLEGDLLVTGGVTMYGNDSSFTPSTIMDAILYDSATLGINSNGQLYVKGGTSGGGLDITALQNYLTQNSYLNVTSGDNRYLQLSGGTITGDLSLNQYLRINAWSGYGNGSANFWYDGTQGLVKIEAQGVEVHGYRVLNADNYSSYALPLSGGTIDSYFGAFSIKRNAPWASAIKFENTNGVLGYIGYNDDYTVQIWDKKQENSKYILHSGNYSSYALPLSGGTLTGHLGINVSTANAGISISYNGTAIGSLSTNGSTFEMFNNNGYGITTLGKNLYALYNWNRYTLWHSGNDGSGSGLDADLLDGLHNGELTALVLSKYSDTWNYSLGNPGLSVFSDWYNTQSLATYFYGISIESVDNNYRSAIAIPLWGNGLYWRRYSEGSWLEDWRCLIDSYNIDSYNAGSATKLQTARTIWGQSFDGTGNVSGVLSGVDGITFNSYNAVSVDYNSNFVFKQPNTTALQDWSIQKNDTTKIFIVRNDGNVGIGTTNLIEKLNVSGGVFATGGFYCANIGTNPVNFYWGLYQWDNKIQMTRRSTSNGYESDYFYIDIYSKNIVFSAGVTMYSDQRKKTILNHVELSLKQIAEAPLIEHYYNSDDKKTTHVGSIAQYWASMNDWFCKLDSEGYYTMEIQNAALASAISIARELDRYETKTDKAINKLKKRICELEEEVERLKSA